MALKVFNKGEGGRPKGARNRLSWSFLNALAQDFEQFGIETIRICRVERPNEYLKIVAGLMPRELEITETKLMEVSDDELTAYIEFARGRLASRRELIASSTGGREGETIN